ncbi:MAG: aminotransferase class V-fold PLP-dependent enzyme [Candidatus Eisenbacteria bacterium]|nr:aminotransferase class V-fold PLP-dependent enzyme [Candidatus Eisenbacteria bacterium]
MTRPTQNSPGPPSAIDRSELERHFARFRANIVGIEQTFVSPFGERPLIYADWTASGRLYRPIEERMLHDFGPFVGNTHSGSTVTGARMTEAYHLARRRIKDAVHAGSEDVIVTAGSGMTTVVNKLQRILGLRVPEVLRRRCELPESDRPVVFITHMEHHSNQTSWLETLADVVAVEPDERGLVSVENLDRELARFRGRTRKIGAFTACSNVTGVRVPYHDLARVMHAHGGVCFVDFAASAPYVEIDMHPHDPDARLDAVYFSPHKFLGGPGTSGVLIFASALDRNEVPDQPGGGTVDWTNPWGGRRYVSDLEAREDGGTPGFLQAIRTALCFELKERMGVDRMLAREEELNTRIFAGLGAIPGLHLLAEHLEDRQSIFSFFVEGVHYNLIVQLLNDRFGIQTRGGCSCAGTYGHYLLHVSPARSERITALIDSGDLSAKPGWVRMSLHPTTTDGEADLIVAAIRETAERAKEWEADYLYDPHENAFRCRRPVNDGDPVAGWFTLPE